MEKKGGNQILVHSLCHWHCGVVVQFAPLPTAGRQRRRNRICCSLAMTEEGRAANPVHTTRAKRTEVAYCAENAPMVLVCRASELRIDERRTTEILHLAVVRPRTHLLGDTNPHGFPKRVFGELWTQNQRQQNSVAF